MARPRKKPEPIDSTKADLMKISGHAREGEPEPLFS